MYFFVGIFSDIFAMRSDYEPNFVSDQVLIKTDFT